MADHKLLTAYPTLLFLLLAATSKDACCYGADRQGSSSQGEKTQHYEQTKFFGKARASLRMDVDRLEGNSAVISLSRLVELRITLEGTDPLTLAGTDEEIMEAQLHALTVSNLWSGFGKTRPHTLKLSDGRARWELVYKLDPKAPDLSTRDPQRTDPQILGKFQLQPAPLRFQDGDAGQPYRVQWDPIDIVLITRVENPDKPSPDQLKHIAEPENPSPLESTPMWKWIVFGVSLALFATSIVVGGVLVWRKRHESEMLTPVQWAMRELDRLEARRWPEVGKAEQYHTALSDVIRTFVEKQFRLHAPQQTTAEFLQTIRSWPTLSAPQQQLLQPFLERCDLVKFAGVSATPEECRATAALARQFVALSQPTLPRTPETATIP